MGIVSASQQYWSYLKSQVYFWVSILEKKPYMCYRKHIQDFHQSLHCLQYKKSGTSLSAKGLDCSTSIPQNTVRHLERMN